MSEKKALLATVLSPKSYWWKFAGKNTGFALFLLSGNCVILIKKPSKFFWFSNLP